jgi:predicted deacetylase
MRASYVWRMDDVTPGMNWRRFWRFLDLFRRCGVVPLVGVVPDNRDPALGVEPDNPEFWQVLRELTREGAIESAQHGYRHEDVTDGRRGAPSEFAGLAYPEQAEKIRRGRERLRREGIATDIWMAPFHSFDAATLAALVGQGFRFVSDGSGLYPVEDQGLVFVPQQLWRPRRMPFGVFTVCLHTNSVDDALYDAIERFLKSGARSVRFTDAARMIGRSATARAANVGFAVAWRLLMRLKRSRGAR